MFSCILVAGLLSYVLVLIDVSQNVLTWAYVFLCVHVLLHVVKSVVYLARCPKPLEMSSIARQMGFNFYKHSQHFF